jgi:hypothetical protein
MAMVFPSNKRGNRNPVGCSRNSQKRGFPQTSLNTQTTYIKSLASPNVAPFPLAGQDKKTYYFSMQDELLKTGPFAHVHANSQQRCGLIKLVPARGVEPPTNCLQGSCSTI